MARVKLTSLLVSVLSITALTLLVLRGVAGFERRTFEAARALLSAGADHVESVLAGEGEDLPGLAARLVTDPALGSDVRALTAGMAFLAKAPKPTDRMRQNVQTAVSSLTERLAAARTASVKDPSRVDAVSLIADDGTVLVSDSTVFKVGSRLPVPPLEEEEEGEAQPAPQAPANAVAPSGEGAAVSPSGAAPAAPAPGTTAPAAAPAALGGAAAPPAPPAPLGTEFVTSALRAALTRDVLVDDGGVVHVGAAPIVLRGTNVGVVVVERRLRALPRAGGGEALLVVRGKVHMGRAPEGFQAPTQTTKGTFLLASRPVQLPVPGYGDVAASPLFIEGQEPGVWAQRFAVPGAKGAEGFVFADLTPLFAELVSFQAAVAGLAVLVLLLHAAFLLAGGRRILGGIDAISDAIGRYQQGLADSSKINERQLPARLHRLVRLINQLLEKTPPPARAQAARSPTLDEVIQAQAVTEPPADVAELEFEGITDAGSMDLKKVAPASQVSAAPPADDDGYEKLAGFDETLAAADAMMTEASVDASLPELPDALEAVDHIAEESRVMTPVRTEAGAGAAVYSGVPPAPADRAASSAARPAAVESADHSDGFDLAALGAPGPLPSARPERPAPPKAPAAATPPPPPPPAPVAPSTLVVAKPAAALDADVTPTLPKPPDDFGDSFVFSDESEKSAEDPLEAHYRDVFNQFVATRKQCGETTGELTFDKFRIKLAQSRDAVVQKHGSAEVRFQVYVKNGKAALKATPLR